MLAEAPSALSVVVLLGLFSLGGLLFWLVTRRSGELMSEPMESDRRVAYHEAGHAVVAWCVRMGISRIHIRGMTGDGHQGNTQAAGHTAFGEQPDDVPQYRFAPAANNLFLAGGSAAERVEFDDCNREAAAYDEQRINSRVRHQVPEIAERILRAHWPAVPALAARLVPPPIDMPGQEAEAIIHAALPDPFWSEAEWIRVLTMLDDLIMGRGSSEAP
jgi:hypothetical protein